jgi:anti-sigma factor RsiW
MTAFFEDHLGLDAVVAFADGELSLVAYQRAAAHISRCESCAAEVAEQVTARQRLRSAACPMMPASLFDALRSIPVAVPAQLPIPGVVTDPATGRVIRTDHRGNGIGAPHRGRGFRLGAGAIVAGLAVGALAAVVVSEHERHPAAPPTDTATVFFGQPNGAVTVAATHADR